jgi:hypothetical protein
MSTEYGFIILRDVPKEEARIDVFFSEIQGGFRGFQLVPAGVHYVSVQVEGTHKGFWCYLQPNEAIVKVFNSSVQQFNVVLKVLQSKVLSMYKRSLSP